MKKRFTEEQILQVLNTAREGKTIAETCRTYGISVVTYYKWKAKFSGMSLPDAKRLRELEKENLKLKGMLADSMLEIRAIKDVLSKKW
jgi:putative transposase